jgi:hypothetical protein
MLRDRSVDTERLRHDKAIEALNVAHDAWSRKRTERLDWLNGQLQRENHALTTFRDVDAAMAEYAQVFGTEKAAAATADLHEPVLSDFYAPSDNKKNREIIFIGLGLGVTGALVYKFL